MPKTLSPWSVCLSMNPEMCQEGLDWDTKGGFVEWGPFLVHFPWVPFLAYTKVLKMTSIHSCTDILTFLCPFIRILQSFPLLLSTLHTYVFFRNRVKTLRYFSLLFFSVRECRKISLSLHTGKSRRLSCQHILSVTLFLSWLEEFVQHLKWTLPICTNMQSSKNQALRMHPNVQSYYLATTHFACPSQITM